MECGLCQKLFNSKKDLTIHVTKDHHSGKTFNCDQCELSYSSQANLRRHLKAIHEKILFSCAVCGNSLSTKQKLKIHYSKCKAKATAALENNNNK